MVWCKDYPNERGWYFWKERRETPDYMWVPYHLDDVNEDGEISFWLEGTEMDPPKVGWWSQRVDKY